MLQSFDFRTLRAMKKLAPEIRRVALWEGDGSRLRFDRAGGGGDHCFAGIIRW